MTDDKPVRLLEAGSAGAFLSRFRAGRAFMQPTVARTTWSEQWARVVKALHANGFTGSGRRVAILDTGVMFAHPRLHAAVDAFEDLTGEGAEDTHGHGTLVALLILSAAPDVRITSIKCLDRNGHGTDDALVKAIRIAGETEADVINISMGRRRTKIAGRKEGRDAYYLDDTAVCNCPICTTAESVVMNTGALLVAAAGNDSVQAGNYDWYCPANAAECLPVVALDSGAPIAVLPYVEANGIRVGGLVSTETFIPYNAAEFSALRGLLWNATPREWRGTSFASPFVAAAAVLLADLFELSEPDLLMPRNVRDTNRTTTGGILNPQILFDGYSADTYFLQGEGVHAFEVNLELHVSHLFSGKRYADAERVLKVWLAFKEESRGKDHLSLVPILYNLAQANLLVDGGWHQAPDWLDRAELICRQHPAAVLEPPDLLARIRALKKYSDEHFPI